MRRYELDYLKSKPYKDLTRGERQAALMAGIYERPSCSQCGTEPRHKNNSLCHQHYKDKLIRSSRDSCPYCGGLKVKKSKACRSCSDKIRIGPDSSRWKGGRKVKDGYMFVLTSEHPNKDQNGYVREHHLVMEKAIGRFLRPGETVHHKNGQRSDNAIENLELWASSHPSGQRVEDLVVWCRQFMADYPEHFNS